MTKNAPAFPTAGTINGAPGMSYRQWVAAQVLAAITQNMPPEVVEEIAAGTRGGKTACIAAWALADKLAETERR